LQIKKQVLIDRVQRRIDKLDAQKSEHEGKLSEYLKALAAYYEACAKQAREAKDYAGYKETLEVKCPSFPAPQWYWEDNMKAAKRNMGILQALEGDVIEVDKLKTGKNFTLESLFEGMLTDD